MGELERRGGKGGGERLGSGINVLLGDHSSYTPGILSTLLDPVHPVGGGLVNPETDGRGRRGRQNRGGKRGGEGVRECFWPASGMGVRNKPIDRPAGSI